MIFDNNISINEEAIFTKDAKNSVYIVLSSGSSLFAKGIKKVTKSEFSHAMISFNSKLDPLYSFGTKAGGKGLGFVVNNPKDYVFDVEDAKYSVYVMYVTDKAKKAMQDALKFFIDNKDKLKYDFHGILDIWRGKPSDQRQGKWFCSRFVMFLISKATDISKAPSLWKPVDIMQLDNISLVNRGFNFYNYDYRVTEKHCNDIKKGKYNAGDVIYENSSGSSMDIVKEFSEDEYGNYLVSGNESYLYDEYKRIYKPYCYKVPEVGFPTNSNSEYNEVVDAAIVAASKYYKFKITDANRNYPFKFFNILNISKEEYIKLINSSVPMNKRFRANLYHVNIRDDNKKISIILVAIPGTIYAMYLLLPNDVLYRFDYGGITYQESANFTHEDYKESAIMAQRKLSQLHDKHSMMNIRPTDIKLKDGKWIFAEYTIESVIDKDNVKRFSEFINKIMESSIYDGCIELPDNLKISGELSISEKSIYDTTTNEVVKYYKNPAKQLQIKTSKKRNDKIKTGNYAGSGTISIPTPQPTQQKPVKESTMDIEKAAEDARKLLTKEILACKDCAYMYNDIMLPYKDDSSYAIIGWKMNKLKPGDDFDGCKSAVFNYCSKIYNQTHKEYCMDCDDNCFYIYKK